MPSREIIAFLLEKPFVSHLPMVTSQRIEPSFALSPATVLLPLVGVVRQKGFDHHLPSVFRLQ